jgi:hypothetical protein
MRFQGVGFSYARAVAVNMSGSDASLKIDAGFPHARGFFVGTAGTLKILTTGGDIVSLTNASGWLPIEAVTVFASGTTASGITALY